MKIEIRERLKPFSHMPGAACLIPGTTALLEAFPSLLRIGKQYAIPVAAEGPVAGFTLEQDLEKNCVFVFGKARNGFYRLRVQAGPQTIEVQTLNGKPLGAKKNLSFQNDNGFFIPPVWERLSLGLSKAQDWDLVWRRFDLKEILPVLFGLGQKLPRIDPAPLKGTGRLLEEGNLEAFCRTAFSKILVPRLIDEDHQGLAPVEPVSGDPCFFLQEATKRVRALFFRQEGSRISFLPASQFPAGRMTRVQAPLVGEFDLEWAGRTLRRALFRSASSGEIHFALPQGLRSFRIRASLSERGRRHDAKESLMVYNEATYFLDRFQK